MPDDQTRSFLVQLPSSDNPGDMALLFRLEGEIGAALAASGIGKTDGWDTGSGNMNVFSEIIPDRWEEALTLTRAILAGAGVERDAVIAISEGEGDDRTLRVVWPPAYDGVFRFF
jgi:hypothetical protein